MKKIFKRRRNIAPMIATFGVVFFLIGMLFAGTAAITDYNMHRLLKDGMQTAGRVTGKYRTGGKGSPTPYIEYEFKNQQGAAFKSDDAYPFPSWDSLRTGDSINVTFLPDDPAHNVLTDRIHLVTDQDPIKTYTIIAIPWFISGAFFAFYFVLKRAARNKTR